MVDRDPDSIKNDIDTARNQLAATVDQLVVRANPQRLADDLKARALEFVRKPAVQASLAGFGVGVVVLVVAVRKIRDR